MNTINLSQFDLATSSSLTPSFSLAIPSQLSIGQTSTNILKLNVVNVVMDKIAAQALLNAKIALQQAESAHKLMDSQALLPINNPSRRIE